MARIDRNRLKNIAPRQKASAASGLDEKIYTALSLLVGAIALAGIGYGLFADSSTKARKGWDLTPPPDLENHRLGAR